MYIQGRYIIYSRFLATWKLICLFTYDLVAYKKLVK